MSDPSNDVLASGPATRRPLSAAERGHFDAHGFLVVRGLFDRAELDPLCAAMHGRAWQDREIFDYVSAQGSATQFSYWTDLGGPSMLSALPRLARLVDGSEALLGMPVYHWYSKLVVKGAGCTAEVDWHQDFATYHESGVLFPHLLTVAVAITPSTAETGCLQVLPGSHRIGRLDHVSVSGAHLADPRWIEIALQTMTPELCELDPGDAVFFHGNTLHRSAGNRSAAPRVHLITHYNAVDNQPRLASGRRDFPYRPLERLPDSALLDNPWPDPIGRQAFVPTTTARAALVRPTDRFSAEGETS